MYVRMDFLLNYCLHHFRLVRYSIQASHDFNNALQFLVLSVLTFCSHQVHPNGVIKGRELVSCNIFIMIQRLMIFFACMAGKLNVLYINEFITKWNKKSFPRNHPCNRLENQLYNTKIQWNYKTRTIPTSTSCSVWLYVRLDPSFELG